MNRPLSYMSSSSPIPTHPLVDRTCACAFVLRIEAVRSCQCFAPKIWILTRASNCESASVFFFGQISPGFPANNAQLSRRKNIVAKYDMLVNITRNIHKFCHHSCSTPRTPIFQLSSRSPYISFAGMAWKIVHGNHPC